MIYNATRGLSSYGQGIGILLLDLDFTPYIPGDVANASTFDFPVTYEVVPDMSVERATDKDPAALETVVRAAQNLARRGVKAITSNCGYLGFFQQELARRMDMPVFLSSLMQLPFIAAMIGAQSKIGVFCARGKSFDSTLLEGVGVDPGLNLVVRGLDQGEHFNRGIMTNQGRLDASLIEGEIVATARQLLAEEPSVGAILLECADLPPYARAVQAAVGLPIFDFVTMINYVWATVISRRFDGFM